MKNLILRSRFVQILLTFYLVILLWWTKINLLGIVWFENEIYLFGFMYALIAIGGAINAFRISKHWGGFESLIGKCIIFLGAGLLGQWFGQTVWSYYNVIAQVEIPYPSIADIGFFSIIPFYSLAMIYLAKAAGSKYTLQDGVGKVITLLIPIIMVSISYILFLKDLEIDFLRFWETLLNFGYPFGEAVFISLALTTYTLSNCILGGTMRNKIIAIILAFTFQYITEYTFLYTAAAGTYTNAGIVDLMYATSFTIMAIGIAWFKNNEENIVLAA